LEPVAVRCCRWIMREYMLQIELLPVAVVAAVLIPM
jgi:hypothetical protein